MFKGLRNKFLYMHMGIVTLVMFVFFGALLISNYDNMQRNTDMALNSAMAPHRSRNTMPNGPEDQPELWDDSKKGFAGAVQPRFLPAFILELDENRQIKNIISMFSVESDFYDNILKLALEGNRAESTVKYDGSYFKYKLENNRIVFLDISKEMQMFFNTVYSLLWIAIPMLLIIFFISLFFANRSIKPIEESYNRQKAFIADASHELKTPLAVISTNADMLMGSADVQQQKWLRYIQSETERMTNLTSSLLYLARMDYIEDHAVMEAVALSKLLEDYLVPLEAVFYENHIRTKIDILPEIRVRGNGEQLRRLVGILVDNAIKYNDGNIRITLERTPSDACLTVYNTGKGIPSWEIGRIWDRFYRGDKSRDSAGGFGLGLAIAKAIAERHGGSIAAESSENEWTRFILRLPLLR